MIESIINIALEIYKNKDNINRVFRPKYLNYDLNKLRPFYTDEKLLNRNIPYVELFSFIENPKTNVKFSLLDTDFKLDDNNSTAIKAFQIKALKEFTQKGKVIFDSSTVRINDFKVSENEILIEIQKSKYSDQVQSHLVLDWENEHLKDIGNATLRGFLSAKYGHILPPLNTKLLSNSIGISSIIFYCKNNKLIPYLPFRNKSIFNKKRNEPSIYEGVYHCSSSGVLEWKGNITSMDMIKEEMYREIKEEIGLERTDFISLEYISFAREILRAGKPQIFFIGFTNLNEMQLIEKRNKAIKRSKQSEDKVEIRDKHLNIEDDVSFINKKIISLEAIGNLYYCERYLEKNGREQCI